MNVNMSKVRLSRSSQVYTNRVASVFNLVGIALRIANLDKEHTAIVEKTPGKEEWCVKSESNPDWSGGCYKSKEKAQERLNQVEMMKHIPKSKRKSK
jgi:hypothetical protein